MAFCTRCGKKLGFVERLGEKLCNACEQAVGAEVDAARARYGETVRALASGTVTASQATPVLKETTALAQLTPADIVRTNGEALRTYFDRVLADDILTLDEERQLEELTGALGMTREDLARVDRSLFFRFVIAGLNDGRLPDFPQEEAMLKPKKGETVYLEVPAGLLKEVTKREYVGGYGGLSFRIAKGVRFSTGRVRGRSIPVGTEIQVEDTGTLSLSSHRAAYLGDRKTIEMPYSKLLSLSVFEDGVRFHVSNRQRAPLFQLESGELVAAVVNAAMQNLDD